MTKNLLAFCLPAALAGVVLAQNAGPAGGEAKKKSGASTLIDAAKKLVEDKDKVSAETKKKATDTAKALIEQVPDDLKNKARSLASDPKAMEARSQAIGAVQAATQKPKQTEPPAGTPAGKRQPAPPPAPVGPQPVRLKPLALDDPKVQTQTGQTIITATESAFFDADKGQGLYVGNVHVDHPQMKIDCHELEVHMLKQKEGEPKKKKPVAASDTDIIAGPSAKKPGSRGQESGIDMAYARGTMVTIEKFTEEGELQIAHCREVAIYDGKTDKITLRGWPSVQRGGKLIEATDPRTYMIIDEIGRLQVEGGPQRTTLISEKAAENGTPGVPTATTPPAPPAGTAPPR